MRATAATLAAPGCCRASGSSFPNRYDNFYLAAHLADTSTTAVRGRAERYWQTVTRYTASSFIRVEHAGHLNERGWSAATKAARGYDWLSCTDNGTTPTR